MTRTEQHLNVSVNVLYLLTFGGLGIESDDGARAPRLRPQRLALLAALAAAGDRGMSRERLMGFFWADSDEARGRHSLRQSLYALRQDLGRDVVSSQGATLSLDSTKIATDLSEFRGALAAGDRARAVAVARGPFLDGFYLPGAPEFERWVEEERTRLTSAVTGILIALASEASAAGDRDSAIEWWRQLTTWDPLSGRYALGYLKALAARGDRATALAFTRQHEEIVRRELEAAPDPEIRRLEAELRAMPSPEVVRTGADAVHPTHEPTDSGPPALPAPRLRAAVEVDATRRRPRARRIVPIVLAASLVVALVVTAAYGGQRGWFARSAPTIAVGFIREDGTPDSLRIGRVIIDMLATSLARVEGFSVLANSRLLELIRPGQDSAAGYAEAGRRAGAEELLEGQIRAIPGGLALDMRRVDLRTGIVRDVYQVSAHDRFAVVDSMTRLIAQRFRLSAPRRSFANATTGSEIAYRLYEEGLRAFYQGDAKAAQRLMRAALEEDPSFAMAAYYEAELATVDGMTPDKRHIADARRAALRLATRAPDRERLTITANLLANDNEPAALAVAESLSMRYPDDPRALMTLGRVRYAVGDWLGAVSAMEKAIVLDSVAELVSSATCRLCQDFRRLAEVYLWWDSLPAAERTARRYLRARPSAPEPMFLLALTAARLGDSASAYASFRQLLALGGSDRAWRLHLDLALGAYDDLERDVRQLLASSSMQDWGNGAWVYLISLRNQGRLREALQFHRDGTLPGLPPLTADRRAPDEFNEGILALERGDPHAAAAVFGRRTRQYGSRWSSGFRARHLTWNATLQGMALAAAGDTARVRAVADSVEVWGRGSLYGRDRKLHHYLRGLVLAVAERHEEAVREFRAALFSPTLGFTRVNYELARCLLHLDRSREAVAILQPALRGEIDASNLYITRTELHELLAQAFQRAGESDSAATHYAAVVKAWERSDSRFHERRERARQWLARQPRGAKLGQPATRRQGSLTPPLR